MITCRPRVEVPTAQGEFNVRLKLVRVNCSGVRTFITTTHAKYKHRSTRSAERGGGMNDSLRAGMKAVVLERVLPLVSAAGNIKKIKEAKVLAMTSASKSSLLLLFLFATPQPS